MAAYNHLLGINDSFGQRRIKAISVIYPICAEMSTETSVVQSVSGSALELSHNSLREAE